MKAIPIKDQVLIRPIKEDHHGIIIPGKEKAVKGEVVRVGPGFPVQCRKCSENDLIPMSVKVGDIVTFIENGGDIVKSDGEELISFREGYVLAILETE